MLWHAQDFKEAARLSAESKAQSEKAEVATDKAKGLRSRAAGLEADEAGLSKDVARLQGEVEAGKRILALAKWRRLKVCILAIIPLDKHHSSIHCLLDLL